MRVSMRQLQLDQYELDPPESEQSLRIAISTPRQHSTVGAFLVACGASATQGPAVGLDWPKWHVVSAHLRQHARLDLPHRTKVRDTVLLRDHWDEVELAIVYGDVLVWYHWGTTA
jgi:hypothetical protein